MIQVPEPVEGPAIMESKNRKENGWFGGLGIKICLFPKQFLCNTIGKKHLLVGEVEEFSCL